MRTCLHIGLHVYLKKLKLYLIRNPFSVASSKAKKNWSWYNSCLSFLNQKDLYDDYLYKFEDLILSIDRERDIISSHILSWSILNYVPLSQFRFDEICVLFYESVYADPEYEVARALKYLDVRNDVDSIHIPRKLISKLNRVTVSRASQNAWKKELSSRQIDRGLEILSQFGFDGIYRDDLTIDTEPIDKLLLNPGI